MELGTRRNKTGHLVPVLHATWILRDDGSISFVDATELQVLVISTNNNVCARYSFKEPLPMRNPSGDKWQFSSDVVGQPGQTYRLSVWNIPKPELYHSTYFVHQEFTVPDCRDLRMSQTQPCIESGGLWRPNISVTPTSDSRLTVSFSPDPLSEEYTVICRCGRSTRDVQNLSKRNESTLTASFNLDDWPRSCCLFHVDVKPFFPHCGNDCERHRRTVNICPTVPTDKPDPPTPLPLVLGVASVLLLVGVIGVSAAVFCQKTGYKAAPVLSEGSVRQLPPTKRPKLLLIYSQDHPLYRDVVLKLCAFLQAQCGILVLLDLLDSSTVGAVGLMRWLELQRQKLAPSDKILVLCSRGVQAKWRAMCGQGHVTSQPDDLIAPFLSLCLSDLHRPGSMGTYVAAYFEEIGSEQDVPSFFDIAVKYKLMKHFEELYFRILDMEKYEPRKVNHVEGIGPDEYFRSESGRELKNAIENFQAFQMENPDWFENEFSEKEEDLVNEASVLIENLTIAPVFECVPVVREGPPIYAHDVLVKENTSDFYVLTPEINPHRGISLAENKPVLNLNPTNRSVFESVCELQPMLRPETETSGSIFYADVILQAPIELHQEDVPMSSVPSRKLHCVALEEPEQRNRSEPVEMDELEELEEGYKGPNSGSDQGYMSKASTEQDSEDLKALLKLQVELMQGFSALE